jgi:hypothetical protein
LAHLSLIAHRAGLETGPLKDGQLLPLTDVLRDRARSRSEGIRDRQRQSSKYQFRLQVDAAEAAMADPERNASEFLRIVRRLGRTAYARLLQ